LFISPHAIWFNKLFSTGGVRTRVRCDPRAELIRTRPRLLQRFAAQQTVRQRRRESITRTDRVHDSRAQPRMFHCLATREQQTTALAARDAHKFQSRRVI
jgi:hypothetical protein